jgi:hypothetical protein
MHNNPKMERVEIVLRFMQDQLSKMIEEQQQLFPSPIMPK